MTVGRISFGPLAHTTLGFERFFDDVERLLATDITKEDGTLTIKGERKDKDVEVNYLHRGIGTRSFTKQLTIADTVEVRGAEFKDGILRVGLENVIPEHKKPRKIEISNELKEFKPQLLQEKKVA